MKLPTLYKRASTGKITEWTIEIEDNQYRSTAGYTDGVKTTTEWTLCQGKNIGRSNETTPAEQALSEAKAIWTKRVEQGSFEDIKQVDQAVYFKPMLAHSYTDYPDLTFPVYSQPKLDGIRCIVKADGMWTRNGKPIISVPHIYDALKPLFEQDPTLIFDGELYADKFANDFNAIVSLVKKTKPTAQDLIDSAGAIEYHIYDLPSHVGVFSERCAAITGMSLPKCCKRVSTRIVNSEKDVINEYEVYVAQGYEGLMVRLDKKYENKRSRSLLKYKSFIDEEYTILDIVEGLGNKTGMVGAFLFQNKAGKRFSAAPKFNWDECIAMWADKKNLIGKSATVKYFNLTPDGVPRFPYVIKINRESYE